MTEQEFNKLKFREISNMTFNDGSSTTYVCVSKPLDRRLKVIKWIKRDKRTGMILDGKPLISYLFDGKIYRKKEKILDVLKRI